MVKLNKLDIPSQWKDEFTKYPHGYSIFEALSKWVDQINSMVTNINQWNTYLGDFTSTFGEVPQQMVELQREMNVLLSTVNSDLTTITNEVAGLADTLLSHLVNYGMYLESELGEEHIIRTLPNGVKDEIDLATGKLIKRVSNAVVLDGNLAWSINETGTNTYRGFLKNWPSTNNAFQGQSGFLENNADLPYLISTTVGNDARLIAIHSTDALYVRIEKSKIDAMPSGGNLTGFKEYLNQYPITLIYQLAEPEIIDLPEVMSPNTREIVRLSEQVDKLINML